MLRMKPNSFWRNGLSIVLHNCQDLIHISRNCRKSNVGRLQRCTGAVIQNTEDDKTREENRAVESGYLLAI